MNNSTQETTKVKTSCVDPKRLQAAVIDMDCLSQDGFGEIAAIAKLALAALETPGGYSDLETIAQALNSIRSKADSISNCVNSQAEAVGCNYHNPSVERRYAAVRAARTQGAFN